MRIWWCQEHNATGRDETACNPGFEFNESKLCRMVPMRLIPDNAETVDREALAAALDRFTLNWQSGDFKLVATAARAYLAALDGVTP